MCSVSALMSWPQRKDSVASLETLITSSLAELPCWSSHLAPVLGRWKVLLSEAVDRDLDSGCRQLDFCDPATLPFYI